MKDRNSAGDSTRLLWHLLTAFTLLLFAFGTNAESGDGICVPLYLRSGAIQGTSTCFANAWGNTPINMGNHYCVNEPSRITRWCGAPPDDTNADNTCPVADPVYANSGATTITEVDFHSGDDRPFVFRRTYRARPLTRPESGFGSLWIHNWQRQLNLANANGFPSRITAYRENGSPVTFNKVSSGWRPTDGTPLTLTQGSSSWTIDDLTTGSRESYSSQGVLLSVTEHDGRAATLTYSDPSTPASVATASGLLIAITDHAAATNPYSDLTIRLSYDAKWRITQMADSTGNVTQYGYDAYDNLVSVTWPDGNVRRYAYEDTRFTSALTGVIDETGSRITTWSYDASGRATAVTHPDSQRNVVFSYGSNATTVTTRQRATTMNYGVVGGVLRTTGNDAGYIMGWDASGNLTSDIAPYGKSVQYKYDEINRPTQATSRNDSGSLRITSVRYADSVSLRPYMVASPRWLRTYIYDSNGNLTGLSETPTTDLTGADGLDAKRADGISRSYGIVYNSLNQVTFAQMYENGQLTGEWLVTQDGTGNLRSIIDRKTGNTLFIPIRDAAHRVIEIEGPGFISNPYYDVRGRLVGFQYFESANPLNGNIKRALKIDYTYASDGTLVAQTGTISTNLGPPIVASSADIDKWINNYESGVSPAGPPLNLPGIVKGLQFAQEAGLEPVCPECAIYAGARFAWLLFQIAKDPMWASKNGIQQATEAKQCKPSGANNADSIAFKRDHYINRAEADNLNLDKAESMVADELSQVRSDMSPGDHQMGQIDVDGQPVQWRAYMLPNGEISVGTIFVIH